MTDPDAGASGVNSGVTGVAGGFSADDRGITVPLDEAGTWRVAFDGRVVCSLTATPEPGTGVAAATWAGATTLYLDGRSDVTLIRDDRRVELGEVGFGSGEGRVAFEDGGGQQVVIDKWGLAQQPFSSRPPEVARFLADRARELCDIARDEVGIELWIAFGSLLGAARHGTVIPHDSDIDLAFLSEHHAPARIAGDCYALRRAFSAAGLTVVNKTGSFLTIRYRAPDGHPVSIDVYACFHFGGLLYETASVRAEVGPDAILPLGSMRLEDVELPAPREPETLLAVSYGPRWRTPDPSFSHQPDHAVRSRFDGWFGNAMRRRRDWELHWEKHQGRDDPSSFAHWVHRRTSADALVVELGMGKGDDARFYARRGHHLAGMDYARGAGRSVKRIRGQFEVDTLLRNVVNLYDLRDALSWGAMVLRRPEPSRVVVARGLLESLRTEERDTFWALARMLGAGSEGLLMEFDEGVAEGPGLDGTWRFPVDLAEVERAAGERGGRVVLVEDGDAAESQVPGGRRRRVVVEWPVAAATTAGADVDDEGERLR